ncbi:MAG: hypothetical protein R2741_09670 [Methanolobus sp.]
MLHPEDELEIRPGRKVESDGFTRWEPIMTRYQRLLPDNVDEATPGGLLAVGTSLDPTLTKSIAALTGQSCRTSRNIATYS